ncbi:PREDICTED: mucin-13 [Propithecus coquereli]|uniref:mucin-13 n=1 Tax=Propithecus coquereli TaxID=379532 RepID=UPI00063FC37C|nr:PREDICTED: mucin-13 [Propithecus coquereli]
MTSSSSPMTTAIKAMIATSTSHSTGLSSPCQVNPCAGGSACVELNDIHFCLCLEGYYYHSSACLRGKTFPGKIAVKVSDTSGLEEENSRNYQVLYTEIVNFFSNVFDSSYGQTVILTVSTSASPSARSEMRAGDEVVTVTIVNILTLNTNKTEESVSALIKNAINGTNFTDYVSQNRCDYYGCEKADDDCVNGLACECKSDWERPNPQVAFCFAPSPKCPDDCNGEHRQCLIKKEGGTAECACVPGYEEGPDKNCQPCAFGYSGLDCQDQFQLILTIVGTIAGVLILSMVIALIVTARSKNKKNIEEQNLIEEDFQNLRLQHTGVSNLGAEGNIFPKIRVATSKDRLSSNPYAQAYMPGPDY